MRGILIKHFHAIRTAKEVGWETPRLIANQYGVWDFNNYIVFQRNGFEFRLACENNVLYMTHKVSISVDNIEVYDDGWIHTTPTEMKKQIKDTVKEIKAINKEFKVKKLDETHYNLQKQKKAEEKQKKIKRFEDEKRRLIEKFNDIKE